MLRATSTKTISTTTTINTSSILASQAAVGGGTRDARKPRVLKRRHSSPRPVEVRPSVSIDGGYVKKPITLMTVSFPFSQSPFLALNSTAEWVRQVVAGKCRDAGVSTKIADVIELARSSVKGGLTNAARDELGLSDSDGEEDAGGLSSSRRKTRKAKAPRTETHVTIRGCTFGVYFHRKVMYVPATTTDLDALFRAIQDEEGLGAASAKKQRTTQTQEAASGDAASQGKVWWWFGRKTWKIRFLNNDGKYRDYTKGLTPPTMNFSGGKMNVSQYQEVKEEFRKKAIKLWNTLDKSAEARLDENARQA